MSLELRKLAVTFDYDGEAEVGGFKLPAGEYLGYAEEQGIHLGDFIQWGNPMYRLVFEGVHIDITADVVMGRIHVREAQEAEVSGS